jgi:hypothetical protein
VAEDDERDRIRHSKALDAELITDPDDLASAEGRNGLRQIDQVVEIVEYYTQNGLAFKLRPSILLQLHRFALEGISSYAGVYRPAGIEIGGSQHQPVDAFRVPEMIEEMCDYVMKSGQHPRHCISLHMFCGDLTGFIPSLTVTAERRGRPLIWSFAWDWATHSTPRIVFQHKSLRIRSLTIPR